MVIVALSIAVASATAPAPPLSAESRALLCAAPGESRPTLASDLAALLVKQQPGAASEIDALADAIAATGKCPDPPPPDPVVAKALPLKGQLEFGLGQSTGSTDMANANIAAALEGEHGAWSQKLRVTLDYQDIEGIAANERYSAAWDIRRTLSKNAFVTGLATVERDRLAGFVTRLTQSVGFGAKVALAPTLSLDLSGGPSRRETEWLGPRGKEAQFGARGTAGLNWKIADSVIFAASTSGIFEAASGTIEGQASITGKLIGPLATRLQFTARHETRAYPGIEPTSTTSRASIVYDF
jgi:putative salt-induced outer membrane protein